MAHKIKVKSVPHINRDGSVGTKNDFIVRCKSRGKLCTHEKFSTRREADAHVAKHWDDLQFVRRGVFAGEFTPRKMTATPKRPSVAKRLRDRLERAGIHNRHIHTAPVHELRTIHQAHLAKNKTGARAA